MMLWSFWDKLIILKYKAQDLNYNEDFALIYKLQN